jgi:hypothetical protein
MSTSITRCNRRLPLARTSKRHAPQVTPPTAICPELLKIRKEQEKVAQDAAFQKLMVLKAANGGKNRHGDIQNIVNKYTEMGFFVTRNHLEYRLELHKKGTVMKAPPKQPAPEPPTTEVTTNQNSGETLLSDLTPNTHSTNNLLSESSEDDCDVPESATETKRKGGRTKGSTISELRKKDETLKQALTAAATLCIDARAAAKVANTILTNGTFRKLIKDTEALYNLDGNTINYNTIKSRVRSNNPSGASAQRTSPLWEVEDLIVDACIRLARMGESLTKFEVMDLADEIIADTESEARLIEFCKLRQIDKDVSNGKIVGDRWYSNFMRRHKENLKRGRCKIQDSNRLTWCTTENFQNMYDSVYEAMVDAKVAIKFDEEEMMDRDGNITLDSNKQFGRKTRYKLTRPDRCVFVDETGCNTNMKDDGQIGGRRYVMAANQTEGARTGATSDIHFTVLAFTSGTGDVIMCAVIMKSEKTVSDLAVSWTLGIDVSKNVSDGQTLVEIYDNNVEAGVSIGGPKCTFKGKEIPCFVCTSPNASITSELLVDMLAAIDSYGIFTRSEDEGMPFLLCDGHHSRTRLPFLKYINDDDHLWKVCIGVPYATHMWQPHDSSELNGTFKTLLYKTKAAYLKEKPFGLKKFVSTDIIPILNRTWPTTLGNRRFAKKALIERGWSVLNYLLMDDERLLASNLPPSTLSYQIPQGAANIDGPKFVNSLDEMLEERLKSEGRKRKYEELHSENALKETNIEKLEKMLSFSSGKLASNTIFHLGGDLRDRMVIDQEQKNQKEGEKQVRKEEMQKKQQHTFKNAAIKYFAHRPLVANDIKALLKQVHQKGDSPLRSKIAELRSQLHRRHDRLIVYNLFGDDVNVPDENIENQNIGNK